jgi:hypothetical protein
MMILLMGMLNLGVIVVFNSPAPHSLRVTIDFSNSDGIGVVTPLVVVSGIFLYF